jgi:hypothetical protein
MFGPFLGPSSSQRLCRWSLTAIIANSSTRLNPQRRQFASELHLFHWTIDLNFNQEQERNCLVICFCVFPCTIVALLSRPGPSPPEPVLQVHFDAATLKAGPGKTVVDLPQLQLSSQVGVRIGMILTWTLSPCAVRLNACSPRQ